MIASAHRWLIGGVRAAWPHVAAALRRAARSGRSALPSFRDLHVYGGAALVGWGIAGLLSAAAGVVAVGAFLVYLGLRRPA